MKLHNLSGIFRENDAHYITPFDHRFVSEQTAQVRRWPCLPAITLPTRRRYALCPVGGGKTYGKRNVAVQYGGTLGNAIRLNTVSLAGFAVWRQAKKMGMGTSNCILTEKQ